MRSLRFLLVGPGALGVSLSAAWTRSGNRCVGVYGRHPARAARARKLLGVPAPGRGPGKVLNDFDFALFAVPDGAIGEVARRWASRAIWRGKVAFHCSGALPASLLHPIRRRGAAVASLHPLTSVPAPTTQANLFAGTAFGIEGEPRACSLAARLVRRIGGEPFRVPVDAKPLYHAAACLASGHLLALVALASDTIEREGILPSRRARAALLALSAATLDNARRLGLERALTGPVARGDVITLRRHLTALTRQFPALGGLYKTLGTRALELALRGGRIGRRAAGDLREILAAKGERQVSPALPEPGHSPSGGGAGKRTRPGKKTG